MCKLHDKHLRGFTLIELMIVVTIIGILAAIALPAYEPYIARSHVAEALTLPSGVQRNVAEHYAQTGQFPSDNQAAGAPPANKILGSFVTGATVENGAIHVTFGNYATATLLDTTLTLRPAYVEGYPEVPLSWSCGFRDAPEGMRNAGENRTTVPETALPSSCR